MSLGATSTIDLDDKRVMWDLLDRLSLDGEPNAIRVSQAVAPFLERRFQLAPAGEIDGLRTYHVVRHEGAGSPSAVASRLSAEIERSDKQYREAIERAEALGMQPLLARCQRELGRLIA